MIEQDLAFAIPIMKISISDWSTKKNQFFEMVDWEDSECRYECYYTDFYKNLDTAEHPYRNKFCLALSEELKIIQNHIQHDVFMDEVWAQQYDKNHFMPPHNHGAIGLSAILYADFDDSVHPPTSFYSPFGNFTSGQIDVYEPKVKEGDLIIFPSMLIHAAVPFTKKTKRTIFAFNLKFS